MDMKIRFLKKKDLRKFTYLVNNFYKRNHILSKSRKIINFYYNFFNKDRLFIIGLFDKNENLLSAMGLMPYKNWDNKMHNDYHIAFWVKKNKLVNSLGFFKFIFNKINPKFLATSGINLKTSGKIFNNFGKINLFDNHYIKNKKSKNIFFRHLKNQNIESFKSKKLKMIVVNHIDKLPSYQNKPIKTLKYFKNKYLKNPFYNYFCLNFFHNHKLQFFFICRVIKIKKLSLQIVRIIDFYGVIKQKQTIFKSLQDFLQKNNYEYIDFLSIGLRKELKSLGFSFKKKKDFIPELFEPYDPSTDSRNYCILKNDYKSKIIMVKGDGDGDRPNIL